MRRKFFFTSRQHRAKPHSASKCISDLSSVGSNIDMIPTAFAPVLMSLFRSSSTPSHLPSPRSMPSSPSCPSSCLAFTPSPTTLTSPLRVLASLEVVV